jgi:hypothetical protein
MAAALGDALQTSSWPAYSGESPVGLAEAGFAADLVRRIDASGAVVRINDLFTMRSPNTGE